MKFVALFSWTKKNWEFISVCFLWFCIWATYNTEIFRIFNPGFPHNALDFFHGTRAFLPFVAIILAIIFLVRKRNLPENFFLTPLGLLSIYTIIGIVSSVFSKDLFVALYWSALYGSAIIVLVSVLLGSNPIKKLSLIININWVIAGIIAIFLLVFFLIQPGVVSSLTYNFLICAQRPYEKLGDIGAQIDMFGMAGTRPTGLGRYAGIAAIIAFVNFCFTKKRVKFIWFSAFVVFLVILIFSKGRTEIIGFIIAAIFVILAGNKFKMGYVSIVFSVILLSAFVIFYNIPCANPVSYTSPVEAIESPVVLKNSAPSLDVTPTPELKNVQDPGPALDVTPTPELKNVQDPGPATQDSLKLKSIKSFSTLSGRTNAWRGALQLFLGNPLLGYGFQADRFFLNGQHVHNTMLQALIQTGMLGLVPMAMAFILAFIYLCQAIKMNNFGEKERRFLIGITGVFVFFFVRAITESSGAYFDADWLFLVPIIAYAQCLKGNKFTKIL